MGLAIFIVNLIYNIKNFLSHLVPEEISYSLVFLIVLIETLSNFIRPFILGIRLRANIIAGHLLIVLVRTVLSKVCVRFFFSFYWYKGFSYFRNFSLCNSGVYFYYFIKAIFFRIKLLYLYVILDNILFFKKKKKYIYIYISQFVSNLKVILYRNLK